MDIKPINDKVCVSGQISVADIDELKALGFDTIINNRPDGEAPDQPANADIQAAAEAAGLTFHFIPMGRDGVSPQMVQDTRDAIENAQGKVFAFCRTGTRSTTLWALSQAGIIPASQIIESAAQAGYDMSHLAQHLG